MGNVQGNVQGNAQGNAQGNVQGTPNLYYQEPIQGHYQQMSAAPTPQPYQSTTPPVYHGHAQQYSGIQPYMPA
jgi:hypothetical protein